MYLNLSGFTVHISDSDSKHTTTQSPLLIWCTRWGEEAGHTQQHSFLSLFRFLMYPAMLHDKFPELWKMVVWTVLVAANYWEDHSCGPGEQLQGQQHSHGQGPPVEWLLIDEGLVASVLPGDSGTRSMQQVNTWVVECV